MIYIVYQGINNVEELEYMENKEAKAKYKRITK